MSSILEALRRSERERQQRNGKDLVSLIAPDLANTDTQLQPLPISARQRAVLVCAGLLAGIACTVGGLLWWHSHTVAVKSKSAEARSAEPAIVSVAEREGTIPELPLIDGRQILPPPRLDTESVNLAELSQIATITEAGAQPLTAPWLDGDTMSPDDILPTPPLPTDPVRKPVLNNSGKSSRQQLGAPARMRSDKLDLSGVSPELAMAFRSALEADGGNNSTSNRTPLQPLPSSPKSNVAVVSSVQLPSLAELPATSRKLIPKLRFEVHNYVSDPKKRWVKFNGNVYRAGAKLSDSVVLMRIESGRVVLSVRGQEATLNALQDWI
ncbi:MAG: general secretion pathway protein GspB [Plesiomonas sp.]